MQPPIAGSVTRRKFGKAALALGAGLAASSVAPLLSPQAQAAPLKHMIDAHSHIWTRDLTNFPLVNKQAVDVLKPPSFTAEELLKLVEPEGVNRVVLIQHHTYHGWDNSYLIDAARRYPQAFRVTGMVDDTTAHPDLTMKQLLEKRVTAFRITSLMRGADKWLDGPGMAAMWKCAAETRQSMCCLINPQDLPSVDAMCKKFPDTPVVIDHFARIGMTGEIVEQDLNHLCALAKHKHTAVKISAYYALGKKKPPHDELVPMIKRLYDSFGPQRLMWASDCPYQLGEGNSYRDSISLIRDRVDWLTAEDRAWLLGKTAERIYYFV